MPDSYGSGLSDQLGIAEESAVGTFVAPTTFYEFNSGTMEPNLIKVYSRPRGAGPVQKGSRVRTKAVGGSGSHQIDVVNKGMGKLFKHMLGAGVSAQVDTTTEYKQTFTHGPNFGMGLTVQQGITAANGTTYPFNGLGAKIVEWTLASDVNGNLTLDLSFDFMDIETDSSLAVPSYPTGLKQFTFLDGALTLDGSSAATLKSVKLTGKRSMKTDRISFGGVKREPIQNGESEFTGEFNSEFESKDAYDAWISGEQQANLVVTFIGDMIPSEATPYKLVILVPLLEYTGSAPSDSGDDVHEQNLPFKALQNDAGDSAVSLEYHTTDTAI